MNNYNNDNTIAALSSAAGKAAISVLRISGHDAFAIVDKIFVAHKKNKNQVQVGFIKNKNKKIDEVVCVFFKAPYSYTGENIVEISVHGNPLIVNAVLEILFNHGVLQALPGEFTYRAFLNGKLDLAQAEAVCSLITSKTDTAIKAAINNISGDFSQKINAIKADLTRFMAYLEASLDYPDEDIPFLTQEQKAEMINTLAKANKNLIDQYKLSKLLQSGLKAVIIGKPNVGKSSLLNTIVGKNRAIVTDIAGTTTDTIEEIIDCHGIPLTLIDTAGIRNKVKNSIEKLGQKKTKEALKIADIVIWVIDSSVVLDQNDLDILESIKELGFTGKVFLVLNKSDLPKKVSVLAIQKALSNTKTINASAIKNSGIADLLKEIAKEAGILDNNNDHLMINFRHWTLLNQAQDALLEAKKTVLAKNEDEIACYEARNALTAFEEILGINIAHDILDTIFSTFCIGK